MDVGGIHGIGSRKNSGFHYWRMGVVQNVL